MRRSKYPFGAEIHRNTKKKLNKVSVCITENNSTVSPRTILLETCSHNAGSDGGVDAALSHATRDSEIAVFTPFRTPRILD